MNNKERKTETKVIPSKKRVPKAGSPLGGQMSRRKNFWQSNWLIELSPRKSVEPRIVGIRSTFRGSTFFRLVDIRLKAGSPLGGKMSRRKSFRQSNWLIELSPRKNVEPRIVGLRSTFRGSTFFRLVEIRLKGGNQGDIDSVSILHEVSSEDTIR